MGDLGRWRRLDRTDGVTCVALAAFMMAGVVLAERHVGMLIWMTGMGLQLFASSFGRFPWRRSTPT